MTSSVVVDTGPLVALLNARDAAHAWAVERMGEIVPPLLTCEAVLAEACYLLRGTGPGPKALLGLLARGALALPFRLENEAEVVRRLLTRYADVPMSLADACLVRMAEQEERRVVFTLDSDFRIYRKHGREAIPVIMPARG